MSRLSIIIPVYNTEKYLRRCLDSALGQTLRGLEIVCVDDGSTDRSAKILREYAAQDERVKIVAHGANRGPFQARLTGAAASSGEWLAFLDSDDYVSADYYRVLLNAAENAGADMAMGNVAEERSGGKRSVYTLAQRECSFDTLEGEAIRTRYFRQAGLNYYWHVVWNKVYRRQLWEQAVPHYARCEERLVMCEDVFFSTVLFSIAQKIVRTESGAYFYCRHKDSETMKRADFSRKTRDREYAFSLTDAFLKEQGLYPQYAAPWERWKTLCKEIRNRQNRQNIPTGDEEVSNADYFFRVSSPWDERFEDIKRSIISPGVSCVSFDVFDTLLIRPFLRPSDLFYTLNSEFRAVLKSETGEGTFADFSTLRELAETKARERQKEIDPTAEDITLDDIYEAFQREFRVSADTARRMKEKEIEAEMRFCTRRNAGFELYELALYMGKKIVCTSNMYLSAAVIRALLEKNGYTQIEKVFVSSDAKLCKGSGGLYRVMREATKIPAKNILHIGDNYDADCDGAKKAGLRWEYLKKGSDAFFENGCLGRLICEQLPFWQGNCQAINFWDIRVQIALVANHYFDNPYRPFNGETDFNADPDYIGFAAAGMWVFGLTRWLIENFQKGGYDTAVFFARDGWLPIAAYRLLKPFYAQLPQEKYLPISRQATIPFAVQMRQDFYKLYALINGDKEISKTLPFFARLFGVTTEEVAAYCKKAGYTDLNHHIESKNEYYDIVNALADGLFDEQAHKERLDTLRAYLAGVFEGKSCVFDIGYSAKPEMYLSALLGKPLDTFFYIQHTDTAQHVRAGNFTLSSYLDYMPVSFAHLDEIILSETGPSCTGYAVEGGKVSPVFKHSEMPYQEVFAAQSVQEAAIAFVRQLTASFGEYLDMFSAPTYYQNLLTQSYFIGSSPADLTPFSCFAFENAIGNDNFMLMERFKQVVPIRDLYARLPPRNYSAAAKALFYLLFDRAAFKRKMSERLFRHKRLLGVLRFGWRFLRGIKRLILPGKSS